MLVMLDLETRSRCDIKTHSGNRYVRDETTELLCGAAVIVDEDSGESTVHVWTPFRANLRRWQVPREKITALGLDPDAITWAPPVVSSLDYPLVLSRAYWQGATFVAHNAEGFDRPYLEHRGFPTDAKWVDTMHKARQSGLPAGLNAVGGALFDLGKDTTGKKVLSTAFSPNKKTGKYLDPDGPRLAKIIRYCVLDVLLMAAAWYKEGWDEPHPDDAVRELHCKIDRRGIPTDLVLAQRLLDETVALKEVEVAKAAVYGVTEKMIRSSVALPQWFAEQGIEVPNVQKGTLERVLGYPDLPMSVSTVINARLAFNRVTEGKATRVINQTCADGRLRGSLKYWGAHTGRFAGAGLQPQNLPAPTRGFKADCYDRDTPKVARDLGVDSADVLASMLRGLLIAEPEKWIGQVDYSQIEARVLLWLAGDESGLQVFRDGLDIYLQAAAGIYGVGYDTLVKDSIERKVGKVATLALGYQGGPGALSNMAGNLGLDLEEEGIDVEETVNAWRDANHLIAGVRKGLWTTPEGKVVVTRKGGLWKKFQAAAKAAILGAGPQKAGRCLLSMRGAHLSMTLPSGRPLVYRNARYEPHEDNWGGVSPAITFDAVRHGKVFRNATYGGSLTENGVQAVARDIMTDAMLRLDANGFDTLTSIHDELLVSLTAPGDLGKVESLMCVVPEWAAGLPIKAEGAVGKRYSK